MERLDPKPSRAHKRASLTKAIVAALAAGVVTFLVMALLLQLAGGTSGFIGASVAVLVGGLVAAITLPTPVRER